MEKLDDPKTRVRMASLLITLLQVNLFFILVIFFALVGCFDIVGGTFIRISKQIAAVHLGTFHVHSNNCCKL